MIKNIIFDISGVLADFNITEFFSRKGFDAVMIKRILKASAMSPYWGQFERAEISSDEAMAGFISMDPEIEDELRRAYESVEGMLTPADYAVPLVKELKQSGYQVYYLSNYSKRACDECSESLGFVRYTDGGLLSCEVGLTKPDPRMFRLLLDTYHLNAAECVFVDDTPENVEAAIQLGMQGIVFTSCEDLKTKLAQQR